MTRKEYKAFTTSRPIRHLSVFRRCSSRDPLPASTYVLAKMLHILGNEILRRLPEVKP